MLLCPFYPAGASITRNERNCLTYLSALEQEFKCVARALYGRKNRPKWARNERLVNVLPKAEKAVKDYYSVAVVMDIAHFGTFTHFMNTQRDVQEHGIDLFDVNFYGAQKCLTNAASNIHTLNTVHPRYFGPDERDKLQRLADIFLEIHDAYLLPYGGKPCPDQQL